MAGRWCIASVCWCTHAVVACVGCPLCTRALCFVGVSYTVAFSCGWGVLLVMVALRGHRASRVAASGPSAFGGRPAKIVSFIVRRT